MVQAGGCPEDGFKIGLNDSNRLMVYGGALTGGSIMKRKLLGLVILALLLVVPLTVHAATAGKFTSVEGKVDITSPGKEARPVNLGDLLNVGDIIRTKSKSKCEVAFPDGSILRLAENSRLRVNEFTQQDGQRNATLDLFRGKIQNAVTAVTGAASGESKYEVRTPTAVCGVRGTFFFVYHQAGITGAAFKEGTGYGYSRNRSGDVRAIHAGQAMIVSNPDLPPVIRPATASEIHQHQRDTAPSEKPKSGAKEDESKPGEGAGAGAGGPSASGGSGESSGQGDLVLDTFNTDPGAGMSSPSGTTSSQAPFSSTTGTTLEQNLTSGSSGTGAVIVVPPEETTPPVIKSLTPVNFSDATKLSNQPDAAFTVEFDKPATIYYNLDGSGYLPATGGQLILSGLPEGSHTMHVKGVDAAGNESPVITYVWTTDYTPPTITLSGTPAAVTNANAADITVSTNKPATYTYTLDGAAITSTNLANLSAGSHTFTVTATDAAGNSATSAYSWTTDYTPPTITLSGTPASVTNANTADITVSTNKPATYTYTLDGVAIASPNLANLPEGSHTFTVTATDAAGNSATSAYSWTTLYSAPIITMNPQATPVADGKTDIRIALAASESADFSTSLDGGPPVAGAVVDFKGLSEGSHTISVQATNQAGNVNTQSLTFDLSRYALTGDFYGCIGGVYGTVAGQVVGVSGYEWGGWDLEMTGSGNPTPNATWTLSAGGGNAADGYWISIAPGTTDFNANTLSGTSQLHYLSPTRLGSGAGTVTGSFDGQGQYSLSDTGAGSYTEKPLRFVSSVSAGLTGVLSDTTTLHDGYYYYDDSGSYSYSYYETPQFRDGRHYLGSMRYQRYGDTPVYYETAYYADGTTEARSWTWNASSGTWTEVPGTQSGVWDTNQSYITLLTTPLESGSVSGDPDVYSSPVVSYGSGLHGLLGGSDSFRSATDENPAAVLFLGNYAGSSYAPGQIWHTEIVSDNPNDGSHTAYDGGAFRGYLAGIDLPPTANPGPRSLEGLAAALYVDPLGNAGYLTGSLSGPAYPEIGMFLMNGGLVPHGMSNVGVTAAKLYDSVWSSSEHGNSVAFAGSFGGSGYIGLTGSEVFYDSSPNQISTMSIVNYDTNAVSPWGIYQLSAAGTFANPDSGAVWSGRIGGAAAFGAARAYLYTEGEYQYPAESGYSYDYDFTNDKTGHSFYREPGRTTRTYYYADGTTEIRFNVGGSYTYTSDVWDTTKSLAEILSAPPADSNRPEPTTSWTETWPEGDSDFGFWLATAGDGNWGGNRIGGRLSGRFLTLNKLGTIGGDLLGSYNDADGTGQGVSAGSWNGGTPLALSAFGFGSLSSHDGTNTIHAGDSEGLIGVTNVPWEGTKNALTIGMFDQQENGSGGYLWNMIGFTYDSGRNSARDGYRPFTTGIWRDGAIDGYTVGIYKTADGKAGFIQGALAGYYYNDLGMWEADGSLTKTQMAAATNQYPVSGVTVAGVDFGMNLGTLRLSGAFNNGSSPQGTISGQGMMLTSFLYLSLLKVDPNDPTQTLRLPILPLRWGIFDMMFTGEGFFGNGGYGNTYSGRTSQGWSAKVGGIGPFTLVNAPFFYLGDITDGAWDADGNIRGTLTGAYQTLERRGTFTGPFFGLGNDGATADSGGWIGSSVGSYVAQATLNAFGGLWGDAANGLFIGESLYTTDGSGNMTLAGEEMGLIAGLAKPWTASAAFQVMGMYDYEDALIGAKTHYLLSTPVSGYDRAADATADPDSVTSGYFKGISAAIWRQTLGAEQRPVLDSAGTPLLDEEGNPVTAPVPVGGSMSGSIRALSVAPETTDANGVRTRTLGVLASDDVAGTLYPGVGIWTAQGNLRPDAAMTMTVTDTAELPVTISILDTAVLPGPLVYSSSGGSAVLSGGFNTESAANGIFGSGTLTTRFFTITGQDGAAYSPRWGIYNLMLPVPGVVSGAYSGKPAAGDGWSAIVGGMGRFGYEDYRAGYWLATVKGDWSAAGEMTGTLGSMTGDAATFGRYLTPTQMGMIGGPLYGIAAAAEEGSGAWQAASVGTWTGQPLAFVSVLDYACRYKTVFSSELAYSGPEHIGDLWDVLIGGTQSLWYETDGAMIRLTKTGMPFSAIGTYDHDPDPFIANTGNNIWYTTSDLYSYNFNTGSDTTYDGGAYLGLMGGTETPSSSSIPGNRSLAGRLIALYIDPAGNAGYLKGTLAGDAYPDIRMFGMDGLMAREQVKPASEVGINAADLTESLDWENIQASVAGNFKEDSVRIGSVTAENQYGDVLAIADWTTNVAQKWGIYGLMLFGGYETETPKTAWEARMGGPAGFGAYTYPYTIAGTTETGLHDDLGYWLAEIQNGVWADGKISGMLDGRFVTHTKMGSVTGDLLGAYNTTDNTWQAVSLGTWEGTPTDFGGEWYHSTLYNYFGFLEVNSYGDSGNEGAFGFQKRPDGNYDFLAIGQYYDDGKGEEGFGGPYIGSGSLWYGDRPPENRYMEAFTGGIWKKANPGDPSGTMTGNTAALYYTEDRKAGLIRGDLTGGFHEMGYTSSYLDQIRGLWKAESGVNGLTTIDKTASLPADFDISTAYVDVDSLYANAAGSFGGNVGTIRGWYYNGAAKFIAYSDTDGNIKSLPFGIYNLKLGGDFGDDVVSYNASYTGKPAGASVSWDARIGGAGYFGYNTSDDGYWLANIAGQWDEYGPDAGHGTISGATSGHYLTRTHMGTIGGAFYGLYTEDAETSGAGFWVGLSVGAYEGTPLTFGGTVDGSFRYFDGSQLYWHTDMTVDGVYVEAITGLWGGTDDSWNGTPALALGSHLNTHRYPLFIADLDGAIPVGNGKTTSFAFAGGRVADHGIAADSIGFYARENGGASEVGFLTFSPAGRDAVSFSDDGSGAWRWSDNVFAFKMGDIETAVIGSPYFMSDYFDGVAESSSYAAAIPNEYPGGAAIPIVSGFVRGNSLPSRDWGIWQMVAGGSHPYSDSETDVPTTPVNTAWTIDSHVPATTGSAGIDTTFHQVAEMVWDKTGKTIDGQAAIAFASWADAKTYVGGGKIKGVFDPTSATLKTWQAIATGAGIETAMFLAMANGAETTEGANAALKALNIPAVQVGKATLTQGATAVNNLSGVTMADVTFFANSTGGAPTIWATDKVSGSYSAAPSITGPAVPLAGGGLTANFGIRNWDAVNNKWGANITSGTGNLSGGTFNGAVQFKGGAAGGINPTAGTISGTAAGIATPPAPVP